DPRFKAMNDGTLPEPLMHHPDATREFAFFPTTEAAVELVHRASVALHSTGRQSRVFRKKWPGIITAFDTLFKSKDQRALEDRMRVFFDAARDEHEDRRKEKVESLGS